MEGDTRHANVLLGEAEWSGLHARSLCGPAGKRHNVENMKSIFSRFDYVSGD